MIRWSHVKKDFLSPDGKSAINVVDGLTLEVQKNEFVSLVGPSGCGKSTLLNLAAGLIKPTQGEVAYNGIPLVGTNRSVGYMTQKDTLLPWKTASENIAIPLRIRKVPQAERDKRVSIALEFMGLEAFSDFYPSQLSGGMRTRVALARTLIYQPATLLMDEPFGALDVQIRLLLQRELARVLEHDAERDGKTVVFVTHDLREAIALSDRVVVLSARPARIKLDRKIEFTRPRDPLLVQFLPEFERIHKELWDALESEVSKGVDA